MKCKWAGDPNDEYCKNCNGCEVMFDGKPIPATECNGYEAGSEEVKEEPKEEHTSQTSENPPILDSSSEDSKNIGSKEKTQISVNKSPRGHVTELKFMSGGSVERNGQWFKFECCETRVLNPDLTDEEVQEEREKLWATVNNEIDSQIADVINM